MSDIEVVIKIPEKVKQAFVRAESNDLKGGYYDHGGVIGNAIKNGTPLPEGHGRLIDISEYENNYCNSAIVYDDGNNSHFIYTDNIPTIIEAESEG